MEEDEGKWEALIRSKIFDFEAEINPDEWETLAMKLDGGKVVRLHPYRKITFIVSAAAMIALLIIGGLVLFLDTNNSSNPLVAVENPNSPHPENTVENIENKSVKVDNTIETPTANLLAVATKQGEEVMETKTDANEEPPGMFIPWIDAESDSTQKQEEEATHQQVEKIIPNSAQEKKTEAMTAPQSPVAVATQGVKPRRWGFGMGGGGYAVGSTSGGIPVVTSSGKLLDEEYMSGTNNITLRNGSPDATVLDPVNGFDNSINNVLLGKVKHKTPISGGLGISYALNDRWALQSGVVYTLLRSNGNYIDNVRTPASWKQNLHFIGIPLSASYTIGDWKRIRFYASAGGMGELNVAGRQKKTITVENLESIVIEKVRMKEPLWSVNSRAGAAYPVWRFVNVYAEAGVSYYFENKSNIETIRSEKPFNISLQAGIRLGF